MEKLRPILVGVVIVLVIPIALSFRSKPLDFERIENEFRMDGLSLTSVETVNPPEHGARAQMRMRVNASEVDVYLFADAESLEKQMKVLEDAAQKQNSADLSSANGGDIAKTEVAKNKLYALVIRSRNEQVRARVLYLFKSF